MLRKKLIALLSITSTLLISSCGDPDKVEIGDEVIDISTKDYKDYEKFFLSSLDDFYSMDGKYSIQLYYESCPSCKKTKPYLFRHLEFLNADMKKSNVYIFDMKSKSDESGQGIINRSKFKSAPSSSSRDKLIDEMINNGVDKTSDTYFFGVPSLYIIENNKLVDFKYGSDEIIDYYRYLN